MISQFIVGPMSAEESGRDQLRIVPVPEITALGDQIVKGINDPTAKPVFMVAGDAGSGKTSALMQLNDRLTNTGLTVPVYMRFGRDGEVYDIDGNKIILPERSASVASRAQVSEYIGMVVLYHILGHTINKTQDWQDPLAMNQGNLYLNPEEYIFTCQRVLRNSLLIRPTLLLDDLDVLDGSAYNLVWPILFGYTRDYPLKIRSGVVFAVKDIHRRSVFSSAASSVMLNDLQLMGQKGMNKESAYVYSIIKARLSDHRFWQDQPGDAGVFSDKQRERLQTIYGITRGNPALTLLLAENTGTEDANAPQTLTSQRLQDAQTLEGFVRRYVERESLGKLDRNYLLEILARASMLDMFREPDLLAICEPEGAIERIILRRRPTGFGDLAPYIDYLREIQTVLWDSQRVCYRVDSTIQAACMAIRAIRDLDGTIALFKMMQDYYTSLARENPKKANYYLSRAEYFAMKGPMKGLT